MIHFWTSFMAVHPTVVKIFQWWTMNGRTNQPTLICAAPQLKTWPGGSSCYRFILLACKGTTTVIYRKCGNCLFCCMTWWWVILARANLSSMLPVDMLKGLKNTVSWSCSYALGSYPKQPDNLVTIVCMLVYSLCLFRQWDGVHGRETWSLPEGDGTMESLEFGTQIPGLVWFMPTQIHRCLRLQGVAEISFTV